MDEIWNKRREKLEHAVEVAIFELLSHVENAAGFAHPLGGGLFLVVGDMETVREYAKRLPDLDKQMKPRPETQ